MVEEMVNIICGQNEVKSNETDALVICIKNINLV